MDLALNNLLVWSLQIGILAGVGGALPILLRLKMPHARLAFLQLVLLACLLLPFIHSWKQEVVAGSVTATTSILAVTSAPESRRLSLPPADALLILLLGAGVAVRFALLVAGFRRLRRYRIQSIPLEPASSWGAEAYLGISSGITSPATFGWRKPVVLLPAGFLELGETMREAILCHEILHVRRKDWLFTIAEEIVRAVLWFHPAIWWLLAEIQLVREQAVDREVVDMTTSRDEYVDALLLIAGASELELAPAPSFLRKRHLKQRVISILKEVHMSKTKSVSALTAGACLLAASCWFVTAALPLHAAPQVAGDAQGIVVQTNGVQLMHRSPVQYPRDAMAKGVQGTVVVQVKLDGSGNVSDASVLSGPDDLRKAVLQSVLGWHFTSDAANTTRQISIAFELPEGTPQPARAVRLDAPVPSAVRAVPALGSGPQPITLKSISISGLRDSQREALLARLPIHEGDTVDSAKVREISDLVHSFDEHLTVMFSPNGVSIAAPDTLPMISPSPALSAPQIDLPAIRVGAEVQQANLLTKVTPAYPALAKQARVQGIVRFEAGIGRDGRVSNLRLISGPPLLVQAAMQAVQQWVYRPVLLNGNPVDVVTTIDVNFTLAE